jgi:CelD/BcsL family acetyltransferase involved in cellulose biosynthesis
VLPQAADLVVEIAASAQAVAALSEEWSALEAATPEATGFQSPVWCHAWALAAVQSGSAGRTRVVQVRRQGRLLMLWPLQIDARLGARVLRWLGEPMTQYGDALALPGPERAIWRAVAEAEIASWRDVDVVALTRLREDGVLAGCGLARTPYGEALEAPFADLRAGSSAKPRSRSAKRRGRKLAAFGEMRLERASGAEESLARLHAALELKRDWLKAKGFFSAGLSHPVTTGFLASMAQGEFLQVHSLHSGERIAAIDIGFVHGGAYRSLLGCFNPHFAEGAPGRALTERLIEYYAGEGLHTFDFLAPADAYKLEFASGATPLFAHFASCGVMGALGSFALKRLRPAAKRLAGAFRGRRTA